MIPVTECKHWHLYKVKSRNFEHGLAVYCAGGSFIGIMSKLGYEFLERDWHIDGGKRHCTVRPIEEVCECAIDGADATMHPGGELFKWIKSKAAEK